MAGSPEEVPPSTRRQIQEVDWRIGHGWGAVCQAVAKRVLDFLDNSEVLKMNT